MSFTIPVRYVKMPIFVFTAVWDSMKRTKQTPSGYADRIVRLHDAGAHLLLTRFSKSYRHVDLIFGTHNIL